MRRKRLDPSQDLLEEDYLPEEEQAEIVRSLEQQQAHQARIWRLICAAVAGMLAVGFLWLAWSQSQEHWGLRPHAHFRGVLPYWGVAAAEAGTALCFCGWAAVLLQHAGHREQCQPGASEPERWMTRAALLGSLAVAGFWATHLWQAHSKEESGWDCLWLPGLPVLFSALVVYIQRTEQDTVADLKTLQQSMYRFKTA